MVFFGVLLDTFGSRACGTVTLSVSSLAVVMLGFGGRNGWYWTSALFFLGGFNVCVFMAVISLAKTMPANAPWFISLCLGLFDVSALIFWVFQLLVRHAYLSFRWICLVFAACAWGFG